MKNLKFQEITSQDEEEDRGLLTPKGEGEKKQKEDGWVDWDEQKQVKESGKFNSL